MERFNRSLKNDLKNVLKNREEQFRFFGDSFQYKNRRRLNRPNSDYNNQYFHNLLNNQL
jgi:hypothetical protein